MFALLFTAMLCLEFLFLAETKMVIGLQGGRGRERSVMLTVRNSNWNCGFGSSPIVQTNGEFELLKWSDFDTWHIVNQTVEIVLFS